MRPDIMRLGRRAVIDVAANVEIELFPAPVRLPAQGVSIFDLLSVAIDVGDLLDVFGTEEFWFLPFFEFPVGIDEENAFAAGWLRAC